MEWNTVTRPRTRSTSVTLHLWIRKLFSLTINNFSLSIPLLLIGDQVLAQASSYSKVWTESEDLSSYVRRSKHSDGYSKPKK